MGGGGSEKWRVRRRGCRCWSAGTAGAGAGAGVEAGSGRAGWGGRELRGQPVLENREYPDAAEAAGMLLRPGRTGCCTSSVSGACVCAVAWRAPTCKRGYVNLRLLHPNPPWHDVCCVATPSFACLSISRSMFDHLLRSPKLQYRSI